MKLIIELDVDASDFSDEDAETFLSEGNDASGITVEVSRLIDYDDAEGAYRTYSMSTEYFKVRIER